MKKIILILVSITTFISCTKNDTEEIIKNTIPKELIGKWQYVEELDYNPPGPYLITNGIIINLKADGTFNSTLYDNSNNINGTYTISTDSIITYNNEINNIIQIKKQKLSSYSANELILDNDYLGSGACTEGCAERYSKLNND